MKNENINIGKLIKDYINQNNIKSSDLAKKIGVSKQTLWNWLSNDDLSVKKICTISKALDFDFLVPFLLENTKKRMSENKSEHIPKVTIQLEIDPIQNEDLFNFIKQQKLYSFIKYDKNDK